MLKVVMEKNDEEEDSDSYSDTWSTNVDVMNRSMWQCQKSEQDVQQMPKIILYWMFQCDA